VFKRKGHNIVLIAYRSPVPSLVFRQCPLSRLRILGKHVYQRRSAFVAEVETATCTFGAIAITRMNMFRKCHSNRGANQSILISCWCFRAQDLFVHTNFVIQSTCLERYRKAGCIKRLNQSTPKVQITTTQRMKDYRCRRRPYQIYLLSA
jgi:hypothetical protein